MVSTIKTGCYLIGGTQLIEDDAQAEEIIAAKTGRQVSREDAKKETISYGILQAHNTSGNMENLQIKFDKLTSHDITFVGIVQTARQQEHPDLRNSRFPIS